MRRAVALARADVDTGRKCFHEALPGYEARLFDSGTSALAVAIADASARHGSKNPEAILPAYCCPDVVAACVFASVRPRLVDTAAGEWGYDPRALRAALGRDTVAVVAVNLLGVGDDAAGLLPSVRANGSLLIQDSAQYLPPPQHASWSGDYVVFSFGRGKPLNLLQGGALALPQGRALAMPPPRTATLQRRLVTAAMGTRLAAVGFNTITHPRAFWLTSRLPGLGLGETRYRPLESIDTMPVSMWGRLGAAYSRYAHEEWHMPWAGVLPAWERLGLQPLRCAGASVTPDTRRLRLALLAPERSQRDELVRMLNRYGLGASVMYDEALNRIAGVPAAVGEPKSLPNAESLAGRLLTLPTHAGVTAAVVAETDALIRRLALSPSSRPV